MVDNNITIDITRRMGKREGEIEIERGGNNEGEIEIERGRDNEGEIEIERGRDNEGDRDRERVVYLYCVIRFLNFDLPCLLENLEDQLERTRVGGKIDK